jgi:hypothetical protein
VCYGPHRHLASQILHAGAGHGIVIEGGVRSAGPLSTTLHNISVSLRTNPNLKVEIARLSIRHWPFGPPRISVEGISIHLQGDPVAPFEAAMNAWFLPQAKLEVGPVELTYQHRVLGTLRLGGVVFGRHEDSFEMHAAQVRLGDFVWRDVGLSVQRHKQALVVGFSGEARPAGPRLTCFPAQAGTSRWLLDLPHASMRPLLKRLGLDLGDEFTSAKVAGSISLDIPDDVAQQVRGRVQMVVDDWPLFAPGMAEPMLGRTLALLSNVTASADGFRWELPRVELTMSVFSLAGKGSLQLGRDKRLVLQAEGERTCRELRRFLPPSRQHDEVQRFLEKAGSAKAAKNDEQSARLEIGWDTHGAQGAFRPTWRFVPACGLAPWPEQR